MPLASCYPSTRNLWQTPTWRRSITVDVRHQRHHRLMADGDIRQHRGTGDILRYRRGAILIVPEWPAAEAERNQQNQQERMNRGADGRRGGHHPADQAAYIVSIQPDHSRA